jgi:hypothetical protein
MAITRMVQKQYDMVDGKYTMVRDEYLETIAHGTVLKTGVREVRIMSDVWGSEKYAIYWDAATQKPVDVWIDTCDYGWMYGNKVHAEVDATPEVKEAYCQYLIGRRMEVLVNNAKSAAMSIEKGCIAKVTRGKTSKGTQGKVIALIKASYGMGYRASVENKLGIATSDVTYKKALPNGKVVDAHKDVVWVWARNCERVDIAEIDLALIRSEAEDFVRRAA